MPASRAGVGGAAILIPTAPAAVRSLAGPITDLPVPDGRANARAGRTAPTNPPHFDFVAPEDGEQVVHASGVTVVAATAELRERFSLPDRPGLVVTHVFGRARQEGLRRGDLIVARNGEPVRAPVDFLGVVRATPPGKTVGLTIWREGEEEEVDLPVDAPPGRPGSASSCERQPMS